MGLMNYQKQRFRVVRMFNMQNKMTQLMILFSPSQIMRKRYVVFASQVIRSQQDISNLTADHSSTKSS